MSQAKSFGVECHALSADEAHERFPYISHSDGIEGAAYIPGDGYIDPYSLTMAYAKGARQNGAKIEEGVCVEEIALEGRRAVGVVTDARHDRLRHPRQLRRACGPSASGAWRASIWPPGVVEHQYFLTEKKLQLRRRA